MTMPADRDPYDVMLDLVRSMREEIRDGLSDVRQELAESRRERVEACKSHADRLGTVERWQASAAGAYGAIAALAAVVGACVSAMIAWVSGGHK
jgi:hypothetical protein